MHAIEFRADVEDGRITVPDAHRAAITGSVRVLVLVEAPPDAPAARSGSRRDVIGDLLAAPRRVPGFTPMARDHVHR
jgi:hypothetical protein